MKKPVRISRRQFFSMRCFSKIVMGWALNFASLLEELGNDLDQLTLVDVTGEGCGISPFEAAADHIVKSETFQ